METLPSSPSNLELRSRLVELVMNDLLGPAGGVQEEIAERNVRDRYLVGVLAPSAWTAAGQPVAASAGDSDSSVVPDDDEDDDEAPAIPDELAAGGNDS